MLFAFSVSYLVLCFLTFTFISAGTKDLSYISYAISLWGLIIIFFSIINKKSWKPKLIEVFVVLFLISFIVSSLFVINYGALNNVKGLIWLSIETLTLFVFNKSNIESKYLKKFMIIFIAISTFYSVISILMAIIGYMHYPLSTPGDMVPGGMAHGRLYGLYADPNYGAIVSVLCILSSIFIINKNNFKKFFLVFIIVWIFNIAYISLSGSRSGLISFAISVFVLTVLYFKIVKHKNLLFSIFMPIVLAALACGVVVGTEAIYENTEPQILKLLGGPISDPKHAYSLQFADKIREECGLANPYLEDNGTQDKQAIDTNELHSGEVVSEHVGVLGRSENEDITNERKDIWLSAIDLFKHSPLIGLSNRNYVEYAKDNIPNTYIASTQIQSMHNIFIDVIVSQGIVGLILWIAILLCIFISLIRTIKKSRSIRSITLLSCFIALLIMGLFYTEIIYVNTIGSVYFWYVFGHLSYDKIKIKKWNG